MAKAKKKAVKKTKRTAKRTTKRKSTKAAKKIKKAKGRIRKIMGWSEKQPVTSTAAVS